MMKVKYYKCPSCGRKFKTLTGWGDHMETLHSDEIPEGYSISRYFYYTMTGKTHGTCRTCKKDTDWNEESQKYNQYCNNPACKQAYVKIAKQRVINQYGKVHLLNDPDMQRKMVRRRKISGQYKMSDGGLIGYTGSYEKKFLEMLDAMFDWPSADIIGPSPHTYYYEYNNEKDPDTQHAKKFYIPDFFIPSLNLEVEIEQTTSGNKKMMDVYAVKKEQKKAIMEKNNHVNFVTVSDNNFTPFFDFLMKAKEMIPEKKDMSDFVMESTYENIDNGEIVMEGTKWNPDDDDDVIQNIKDWAEENDTPLKISKEGEWGLNAFRRGGDTLFLVGNCPNVRMVLKGLKSVIDTTKYTVTLDNYNTIFLKRKKSAAVESINITNESYLLNKSDIYYNKDKFDSGETNLCFITGLSGSGKSTMGRHMSSDNIEHYELDDVILNKESYTMNELRKYGGLIYNFFNTIGKKYYYTMEDVTSGKVKPIGDTYTEKIINDFVKYSMSYARSHPNTKFVIEGIWLYRFISPKILENYSVYIKGTSALTSSRWGSKRNIKNDELESGKTPPLKSRVRMIKKQYIACFKDEKKLKQFRDYFSKYSATKSMNTACTAMESGYLHDTDYICINFEKLYQKKVNFIFVTGLSGSGKSTYAKRYIEMWNGKFDGKRMIHLELDHLAWYIKDKGSTSIEEYKEFDPCLYAFILKEKIDPSRDYTNKEVGKLYRKYIKFIPQWCSKNTNNIFVVEGIQIYEEFAYGDMDITVFPMVLLGTSALKSALRAYKRNGEKGLANFGSLIKWLFRDEKILNQIRKKITSDKNLNYDGYKMITYTNTSAFESTHRFGDFTFLDISENRDDVVRRLKSKEPAYVKNIDNYDGEIVLHNDKVIGQVFVGNEKTKDRGFITGLWVEKSYRRSGLGTRLLDDAVKTYDGIDLTVLKDNKEAINLYEKYGFDFAGYVNDKREIETDFHKQKMMYMKLKAIPEIGILPAIEEANYSKDNCYPIYIVLMHSGTLLANIIQKFTNDEFSHACISFNSNLSPMYSFGNKKVGGVDAGFTIQSPASEFFSTKKAYYKVYVMYVNRDAYQKMRENLDKFLHDRLKLKYDLFSLLKVWRGKPSEESKKFFCSRFVMQVIGAGRPLEKVASLYKPQDIAELNDISCVNQGDDFSKYDYHITEKNLKKVQRKQFDSVAFESLLYDNDDFQDIALEGFFSFMKKDNDESVAHWKDKLFGPRELMKRELGHAKSKKFGPFIDVVNGFIIIRGINYNLLKIRIKDFYKDRNVYNIFLPIYDALSYRKFEKKRIQRAEIKIDYLETPVFFALELTKLFSELGEWYNDRRYMIMANLIYKRTWLKEADENSERVAPLSTSRLSNILKYKLLDYQEDFIKQYPILKAQLNLKGYCLAFEQGLGKTFTAVSLAECLSVDHVYIVCPNTSDMPQVWKREIKKYIKRYDDIDTFLSEVMICTDKGALESPSTKYYIVNNESISKMLPYVKSGKNMLILDESHNFRNIKGKRTLELIELQKKLKATDTLCMSGTPVKGTPNEICPVLRLIDPTFTNKVAEIYNHAFNVHHEIALSLVKSRFGRIMMRETKAVLGKSLPPKEYKDLELQVSNSSQYTMSTVASLVAERYSELFHSGLKEATKLKDEFYQFIAEYMPKSYNRMQFNRLVDITALAEVMPDLHEVDIDFLNSAIRDTASNIKDRQKAKRFDYIVKNYLRYNLHCRGVAFGEIMPKKRNSVFIELFEQNKELIFKMIQENPTKTIIFSQFRKVCNYIHNALIDAGIGAVLITGEVGDRMPIVDAFKDNDALTVMVATPKTLGVGVTLTEASQVFFFGPPWRNTDYDQCADRVHRIGQTRQVTIYNVLLDTGEELNLTGRMSDILEWSKSMVSEMVDSSLNKTTEDQFADEILSANESATNLDEIREFLDQTDENPIVTGRVLPKRFLSSILTVTRYFANEDLTTSVTLPEGIIIDDRAMWWDESDEMTFANLRWSPYASAVFASIAESGKKANTAFVKVVDDGIPHWQLVTLKKIKAGSKLTYHPHTSDMSFDKDLR